MNTIDLGTNLIRADSVCCRSNGIFRNIQNVDRNSIIARCGNDTLKERVYAVGETRVSDERSGTTKRNGAE